MNLGLIGVALLGIHVLSQVAVGKDLSSHFDDKRSDLISRAEIWKPTSVPLMDLFVGPVGLDAFRFDETVHCQYVPKQHRHGTSRKFFCRLTSGEVVKVRYGQDNNEVYGQVAASRLLWALGFGANANYPVQVICNGCSSDPWNDADPVAQTVVFSPATIERKEKGLEINADEEASQGWGWDELETTGDRRGANYRAQVDALKLLGVFFTHVDSRPNNQRLVCLEAGIVDENGQKHCIKPFMYLSDVGTTFGAAHERSGFTTLKLRYWKKWPVWSDPENCIADLEPSEETDGMLRSPHVSEAGRKFLADLLMQLSDAQIKDLFRAARADQVDQLPGHASIEEWVEAFKERRAQIVDHRCR